MRGSLLAVLVLFSPASTARAQDRAVPADSRHPTITVPAGTRLHAVLERSLTRRTSRPGNPIYLQLDHPLVVSDTVAIPAGTYLEGVLDNVTRSARGFRARLGLHLTRLVYGNGYVLALERAAEGRVGEDLPAPPSAAASAMVVGVPAAIGAGVMTAEGARSGAPTSALVAPWLIFGMLGVGDLLFAHRAVDLDEGTGVDLVLRESLVLDARRAMAPGTTAFLPRPRPPAHRQGLCYSPGTPGTPDVVIPGTPATPDVVIPGAPGSPDIVIPGTPGTPPTIIPGTPGTPGSWEPCDP